MPIPAPSTASKRRPWIEFSLLFLLLAGLSWIAWQKWETVWIERSAEFLPPEWQAIEAADSLTWRYPIYRSNDTYQWVHVADRLAAGDRSALRYRDDEGPLIGRTNAWHSGLAYLLSSTGKLVAAIQDWPTQRGVHHAAHWLGAALSWIGLIGGSLCMLRFGGVRAGVCFALLYFFNAGIQWDFAFSRLDHEAVYQLSLLFQVLGLSGIFLATQRTDLNAKYWAILAGVATAIGWWVSTTTQVAIEVLMLLALIALRFSSQVRTLEMPGMLECARAYRTWGITGALGMLCLLLLDSDLTNFQTLATLQPIHILAHLGAATIGMALYQQNSSQQKVTALIGLVLGLSPLLVLICFGGQVHPWFDPFQRALHEWIVEFQSPLRNGLWSASYALQSFLMGLVAWVIWATSRPKRLDALVLIGGLFLISLFQSRWLGFLATTATIYLCLALIRQKAALWGASVLIAISGGSWFWQLKQIESNPGISFITDMFLQVGARDINLNLDGYANGQKTMVAMPYAFASTSALFESVHPLGTFYWENRDGLFDATTLFASRSDSDALEIVERNQIQYLVVQAGGLGRLFANMVSEVAHGSQQPAIVDASLAWRLSTAQRVPDWCEAVPFYGTFDAQRFDVRIYRIRIP